MTLSDFMKKYDWQVSDILEELAEYCQRKSVESENDHIKVKYDILYKMIDTNVQLIRKFNDLILVI